MAEGRGGDAWGSLWRCLDALQDSARRLRRLSQEEPLVQARPDFPRARIGGSHGDEVRRVLETVAQRLEEARQSVPQVLGGGGTSIGVPPEEAPDAITKRLAALSRMGESLMQDAFQPQPALPKHAPPYLAEAPKRMPAGSKAVMLSDGIEEVVAALRNALLAEANAPPRE